MLPLMLALYGGPNAETADYNMLIQAKIMEMNGLDRQEIWDKTGWFRGAHGSWQFEIDDSKAKYKGPGKTLGDVLDHPEYFKAYPDASKVPVQVNERRSGPSSGLYYPSDPSMVLTGQPQDLRSTLLHETNHDAQKRENLKINPKYRYTSEELQYLFNNAGTPQQYQKAWEKFQNNPLEIESRSVQDRMDYSPELRKKFPPWTSY